MSPSNYPISQAQAPTPMQGAVPRRPTSSARVAAPQRSAPQRARIRQYSMTWLMRAACRVYEREVAQHAEARGLSRRLGISALFDLSDTSCHN